MFRRVLQELVEKTDGCKGAIIMGTDGITVEQVWAETEAKANLEATFTEFISLVRNAERLKTETKLGRLLEATLTSESGTLIMRFISNEYFIAMMLRPDGNFGRGRFELKRAELKLEKELVF